MSQSDDMKGRLKQAAGDLVGDENMQKEGAADQKEAEAQKEARDKSAEAREARAEKEAAQARQEHS